MNRFKAAAPLAKRLYKSGRYKNFSQAMAVALRKKGLYKKPSHKKRKVGATLLIERHESRRTKPKNVVRITRTKVGRFKKIETISGLISKARTLINEKIDRSVLTKYHAKGKRAKRKAQKKITELRSALKRLHSQK